MRHDEAQKYGCGENNRILVVMTEKSAHQGFSGSFNSQCMPLRFCIWLLSIVCGHFAFDLPGFLALVTSLSYLFLYAVRRRGIMSDISLALVLIEISRLLCWVPWSSVKVCYFAWEALGSIWSFFVDSDTSYLSSPGVTNVYLRWLAIYIGTWSWSRG